MKRNLVVASAALAVVLIVGAQSLADANTNGPTHGTDGSRTVQFTAKKVGETELDLGAADFSVGDRSVRADNLERNGKRVGDGVVICDTARITPGATPSAPFKDATLQCNVTYRLKQGQITAQGLVTIPLGGSFTLPIIGGTGDYRDARGQMTVAEVSAQADEVTATLLR